jgi:hypothetical protein
MALGVGLLAVLGGSLMKTAVFRMLGLESGTKWARLRVYHLELLPIDLLGPVGLVLNLLLLDLLLLSALFTNKRRTFHSTSFLDWTTSLATFFPHSSSSSRHG